MFKPWEASPAWRLLCTPLSWLYAWGQALLWRWNTRRPPVRVSVPVVSVGNLSVGGTGKSPLVRAIAKRYRNRAAEILLRGYGAQPGPRPLRVLRSTPWRESGDEALEHARQAFAPVWIGADRVASARAAVGHGAKLLVLDDGFQRRWQLARDLDLLCADYAQLKAGEALLPAGPWREPWKNAAQAQALLVSGAPEGFGASSLPEPFRSMPVFRLDSRPVALRLWPEGKRLPLSWLKGRAVLAFSGLGRPERFEEDLRHLGAKVTVARFGDHHAFSQRDIDALNAKGSPLVCTCKDSLRLDGLRLPPVHVLEAEARVDPAPAFWKLVDNAVRRAKP